MKANEAPEKLYITYKGYGVFDEDSTVERTKDSQTEYTRTDAFIEKALAYLNSKFYFHNAFNVVISTNFNAMEELFEDFENYMKRE